MTTRRVDEVIRKGRVLHTGQAIVDIVMQIPALPPIGGDVFSTETLITAGGGFNVMAAARRDGAEVVYLGTVGSGPFARIVSDALESEGIRVANPPISDLDTGFSVAMVDSSTERTFVTTLGAEGDVDLKHLSSVELRPRDVVYVSGYSLLHARNHDVLMEWLPVLGDGVLVVFDTSPMVEEIPEDAWELLRSGATIWSLNDREARLAGRRLGIKPDLDLEQLFTQLSREISGSLVLRDGPRGVLIGESSPVRVPGSPVAARDTNGAGDAHTGVLMAALASGDCLEQAARRANVAAALAVTRFGPATAPVRSEIDEALAQAHIVHPT